MAKQDLKIRDLYSSYVRPSEGAGTTTLVSTDRRNQIFQLSAARTCVLPTTGVKSGDVWTIENVNSTYKLTVQSSNLSELTTANSSNATASIYKGKVVICALQDAPTTPAHWRIKDVYEQSPIFDVSGSLTFSVFGVGTAPSGGFSYAKMMYDRVNNKVNLTSQIQHVVAGSGIVLIAYSVPTNIPTIDVTGWSGPNANTFTMGACNFSSNDGNNENQGSVTYSATGGSAYPFHLRAAGSVAMRFASFNVTYFTKI